MSPNQSQASGREGDPIDELDLGDLDALIAAQGGTTAAAAATIAAIDALDAEEETPAQEPTEPEPVPAVAEEPAAPEPSPADPLDELDLADLDAALARQEEYQRQQAAAFDLDAAHAARTEPTTLPAEPRSVPQMHAAAQARQERKEHAAERARIGERPPVDMATLKELAFRYWSGDDPSCRWAAIQLPPFLKPAIKKAGQRAKARKEAGITARPYTRYATEEEAKKARRRQKREGMERQRAAMTPEEREAAKAKRRKPKTATPSPEVPAPVAAPIETPLAPAVETPLDPAAAVTVKAVSKGFQLQLDSGATILIGSANVVAVMSALAQAQPAPGDTRDRDFHVSRGKITAQIAKPGRHRQLKGAADVLLERRGDTLTIRQGGKSAVIPIEAAETVRAALYAAWIAARHTSTA